MPRARFRVVARDSGAITIKDLGPWDAVPTVTNDVEAVVEELVRSKILGPGQHLYYFDSEGRLDETLVRDGKFAGFAPGPGPRAA